MDVVVYVWKMPQNVCLCGECKVNLPIVVVVVASFHCIGCVAFVLELKECKRWAKWRRFELFYYLVFISSDVKLHSPSSILQIDENNLPKAEKEILDVLDPDIRWEIANVHTAVVSGAHNYCFFCVIWSFSVWLKTKIFSVVWCGLVTPKMTDSPPLEFWIGAKSTVGNLFEKKQNKRRKLFCAGIY